MSEKASAPEKAKRSRDKVEPDVVPEDYAIPSVPPAPADGPWRSYKEQVASLAQRLVDAQRPIRVLQSLRWDAKTEEQFFKTKCRELPRVDAEYYTRNELDFRVSDKCVEFEGIARDAVQVLGEGDALADILVKSSLEYRDLVRMLSSRGTPAFYAYSRRLYGSAKDTFPDGKLTVKDLGRMLYEILSSSDATRLGGESERDVSAEKAAKVLNARFASYFGDDTVRVEVDDDIVSDAAAGSDYVKVRSGAMFSDKDIDILEVHEGWVHVATSLNGQDQPVAKWLAKGPPRTAAVQEGLASFMEILTFRSHPARARRLNDRILAVDKAEDGANFLEVFEWYRTEGYGESECYANTQRIFRGGVVEGGGPFTKDACYCKGIVLNYAFMRSAIAAGRSDLIPLLFVGKVAHEDIPVLAARIADGVVRAPKYLPPMFRDLSGLGVWMAYSTFFTRLGADELSAHYATLFSRAG